MKESPAAQDDACRTSLKDFLPGDDNAWKKCSLGAFEAWPETLKAHVSTISCLPYPAAILWGDDYILLHNKSWDDAAGVSDQGQPQKESLSPTIVEIIRSVATRRIPKEVQGHDLVRDKVLALKQASTALLSPLIHPDTGNASAILIQLLPKPMLYQSLQLAGGHNSLDRQGRPDDSIPKSDVAGMDSVPIDEHPFFRRFAEMLPSGLAILDHNAQAVFVNQHFYDLTTLRDDDNKEFTSWPQSIHPDDYDRVMQAYQEAFKSQKQLRTEFRALGEKHPWRLLLLTPLGDENLKHVSLREYGGFICSIVDITSEKSAEIAERESARQARERKEQQERFIDMISHEIRNPLSAVLHCAEEITDAVKDKQIEGVDVNIIREAVETIHLCVTHQKNIVDDVLSFSKLDASLLSLAPKPAQPSRYLAKTLKMFQHEFRKEGLDFGFTVDDSYTECHVDWVLADIARISQVLINLITNAIKFTHHADGKKMVHCSVGVSLQRPKSYPQDLVFFESDSIAYRMDATNTTEWGNGESLYVTVAVEDTGIGISDQGQQRLFERFRQATPKTEEVYGGSGLGLNISRKICHLHGGEIGVHSKEGVGSTFAFFFKVRRSEESHDDREGAQEEEGEHGEEKVRGQINDLKKQFPDKTNRKDPFEWTPGAKDRPDLNDRTWSKQEQLDNIRSPTSQDGQAEVTDEYARQKRPSLSQAHQSSERMISADVSAPTSPGLGEPDRPIMSFNRSGLRAHVLLVEDNIINQKIVFRKLESQGFNVTTANNGQEAVEAAKNAPRASSGDKSAFDVILMDQEMPIMDGNAAARAIRQYEKETNLERVPILGVTANVRGAQQDEMMESGMDDVMSKPYKIEDLVAKISKMAIRQGFSDGDVKQSSP